jgi:coenzyme F420 hydrogenase subunit beta
MQDQKIYGQKELREKVLANELCTGCGACVNLCPYMVSFKDRIVLMHSCSRTEGRCYAFCPRTPTDLQSLRESLFPLEDTIAELGSVKGFFMTRAADPGIRHLAQHGATTTVLISLALQEGMIETAIIAGEEEKFLPRPVAVANPQEVTKWAGSKFVVSPTVAGFNETAKQNFSRIGVVALPCQAIALAKMRSKPIPSNPNSIEKLQLVVGLFCGWALSWKGLRNLLQNEGESHSIIGVDVPPSQYQCLEVHTREGIRQIALDKVLPWVRESCLYCSDMTAEFSDISVGSGRLPEGWEIARSWNQVIVRTQKGLELIEIARKRGFLEFREMPEGNLEKLKKASLNKKKRAAKYLQEKVESRRLNLSKSL